ncbi:hypothetical protein AgCh_012097 [Apium graveolens]
MIDTAEETFEVAMDEKASDKNRVNKSTYPKDQPWKELEEKVGKGRVCEEKKRLGKNIAGGDEDTIIEKQNQGTKGLPHQQVPQPDDFSTQGLENL